MAEVIEPAAPEEASNHLWGTYDTFDHVRWSWLAPSGGGADSSPHHRGGRSAWCFRGASTVHHVRWKSQRQGEESRIFQWRSHEQAFKAVQSPRRAYPLLRRYAGVWCDRGRGLSCAVCRLATP